MSKKELKTQKNNGSVSAYIKSIDDAALQKDGKALLKIFKETTGKPAKMWGDSIVGFGEYHYTYASGREGDWMATGFSLRKSGPTIYIMPGYQNYSDILKDLGPHKLGKSCLYLKRLSDVNEKVLKELIKTGLKDLKKQYPVK